MSKKKYYLVSIDFEEFKREVLEVKARSKGHALKKALEELEADDGVLISNVDIKRLD